MAAAQWGEINSSRIIKVQLLCTAVLLPAGLAVAMITASARGESWIKIKKKKSKDNNKK